MEENSPSATESDHHPDITAQHAFQVHHHPSTSSKLSTDKPIVKAKRRRTTPQDHAILEAAYLRNSKPDKTERAHIVSQVALGEKEVQIWFQNRRQNDRRRSKPLQPHELAAHLHNSPPNPVPPQMTPSPTPDDSSASHLRAVSSFDPSEPINRPASRGSSIHDLLNPTPPGETSLGQDTPSHSTQDTAARLTPPSSFEDQPPAMIEGATSENECAKGEKRLDGEEKSSSEQGSARKRDHDEMAGGRSPELHLAGHGDNETAVRPRAPLVRTSSIVRLAMTVDGAVKIRTSNEPTPSPEKPRAPAPNSQSKTKSPFVRSKSAINAVEIFCDGGSGATSKPMGAGFGRSRDARTWEFYCDSNAKDALSTQAEAETVGSAVSAINLIRSNSFKSRSQALSPSLTNTNLCSTAASSKDGRPKLCRARSSLGRLQGLEGAIKPSRGKSKPHDDVRSPGDSDKENWAPGTRMSEHPLRRTQPSARQRPILQENESVIFPDASSTRKRHDGATSSRLSPGKEKAKGEDIECIQGLLSLSQGAWR